MSEQPKRGLQAGGLDPALEEAERRKSSLLVEAHLLRARQDYDEAARKAAEAARLEERLAEGGRELGLADKANLHAFSAACCWEQAGNLYDAIAGCEALLAGQTLAEPLRQRVEGYAQSLRRRRIHYAATMLAAAS